jgi:hypothetical protein
MKKIILSLTLVVISLMTVPSAVFGTLMIDPVLDPGAPVPAAVDPNAHINLFAGGTTSQTSLSVAAGATFSLDTYIQFTGFTSTGLSYWIEASSALAPHLTLTTESYFQNWNGNQTGTNNAFNFNTNGTDSGFLRETRDLGSTSGFNNGTPNNPLAAGTYQVSTLNFSLDPSTPAGTYVIQLTTLSPVISEINDNQSTPQDHAVALASFTLTVVPEPATLSLLGLGGLGSLGMTLLRARRRKA